MKNEKKQKAPAEISIVVPSLNEEITIGRFVDWCKEGLKNAGVDGQILIVDSSTDATPDLAKSHGAEVLSVPRRGLGQAYKDSIPYIKGNYIIMGDCDLTYDFRELDAFVEKLDEGYEFVMGSRFKGSIQKNAMPKLHQYFGTPLTTWFLNFLYGTKYSDIHCGMRAITKDALLKMNLKSSSWEYASEMVLKAAKYKLKTTEVPIKFYKDPEGRQSHHKRTGWLSSWKAGWINVKAMLTYAPDFFLLKPGIFLFTIGTLFAGSLSFGPFSIGRIEFNLHWMLMGFILAVIGQNAIHLGVISRLFHNFDVIFTEKFFNFFTYDRGMLISIVLAISGLALNFFLISNYIRNNLRLSDIYYEGIAGLFILVIAFQLFIFTIFVEMIRGNR